MHENPRFTLKGVIFLSLAAFCSLSLLLTPCNAEARNIRARSALLMDIDRVKVLYEQNANAAIAPASLTKIMSMYVVFDHIKAGKISRKDMVTISKRAASKGGSRMGLKAGQKISLDRLLYGLAVSSGNDASVAVAEHVAGSEAAFVKLMNAKAKKLGMKKTVFKNAHGLPAKGQVTTARDMMNLSRNYIMIYPQALTYHSTTKYTLNKYTSTNKNSLLGSYDGADGLKTGWINASGYNIIATARRGNTRLIAIILGAENSNTRAKEIERLMDAGFDTCAGKTSSVTAALAHS